MKVIGLRNKTMRTSQTKLLALSGWVYSLVYGLVLVGGFPYAAYRLEQLVHLKMLPSALMLKVPALFLIIGGLVISGACMAPFSRRGHGTPACFSPAQELMAQGIYRYSRNPMILGNVVTVLGLGLFFHSVFILLYGMVLALAFHFYFVLVEEPQLELRFGDAYRQYAQHVHRWVPRIRTRWHEKVKK